MSAFTKQIRHAIGRGILAWGHKQTQDFEKSLADCSTVQNQILKKILSMVGSSELGTTYDLNPDLGWAQLCQQIPVMEYEDFRPFISKAQRGNTKALFASGTRIGKIHLFASTSGTTSEPKWIPITEGTLVALRRSWLTWGYYLGHQHPEIAEHGILSLTGSFRTATSSTSPTGSITGFLAHSLNTPIKLATVVPTAVGTIESHSVRQYLTLRLAANADNIRLIATANPSTLIQFAQRLADDQDVLIHDLFDGTTQHLKHLPSSFQRDHRTSLRFRDKPRAKHLAQIASKRPLSPKDLWPNLELLGVWTGGHAAHYLPRLRQMYQGVTLRDHGLSATEGHFTIPFEDESDQGILDIHGGFYEFIEEHDIHTSNPITLLPEQIHKGKRYEIVVSNFSGLIRYRMHDLVECTGHLNRTPILRFISKTDLFANISGEKLSLWQTADAISKMKASFGLEFEEYLFSATMLPSPGYICYLESSANIQSVPLKKLESDLDQFLKNINHEYLDKRQSKRLSQLRIKLIEPKTFVKMRQLKLLKYPHHAEQYKHPFIINNLKVDAFLQDHCLALDSHKKAAS